MAFEPVTLQSRLSELCWELGCPPGRDMIEWLKDEVITLRQDLKESQTQVLKCLDLFAKYPSDKKVVRGELFSEGPKFFINTELGIEIGFDGYGIRNGVRGSELSSAPIYIEFYQGEVVLYVWADINDEDYSHKISLEGARESNRKEYVDETE